MYSAFVIGSPRRLRILPPGLDGCFARSPPSTVPFSSPVRVPLEPGPDVALYRVHLALLASCRHTFHGQGERAKAHRQIATWSARSPGTSVQDLESRARFGS